MVLFCSGKAGAEKEPSHWDHDDIGFRLEPIFEFYSFLSTGSLLIFLSTPNPKTPNPKPLN